MAGPRTKARRIDGGRQEQHRCGECAKVTTFSECDVVDKLHVFFVPLLEMKSRRLVCTTCGEDVDPS
jgi:hypothetical protein